MKELVIGVVAVGIVTGIALGRSVERAQRAVKDVNTAVTNLAKAKKVRVTEVVGAIVRFVAVSAFVAAMIVVAINSRQR